jgi:hypothetical protein
MTPISARSRRPTISCCVDAIEQAAGLLLGIDDRTPASLRHLLGGELGAEKDAGLVDCDDGLTAGSRSFAPISALAAPNWLSWYQKHYPKGSTRSVMLTAFGSRTFPLLFPLPLHFASH